MSKSPRLHKAVTRFVEGYANTHTRRSYARILAEMADCIGTARRVHNVRPKHLDHWYSALLGRSLSPFTVSNYVRSVKSFWNWSVRRGWCDKSPARFINVRRPRPGLRSKAMPLPVLTAMLDAVWDTNDTFIAHRDYTMLVVLATFGPRANEVASLRIRDVRFDEQTITFWQSKTGRELTLPMPEGTAYALRTWIDRRSGIACEPQHGRVFISNRTSPGHAHQPLHPDSVSQVVYRLAERVSGVRWRAHAIRHWRGQSLADANVPPPLVQAVLGHTNLETTMLYYTNMDGARLRTLLNRFDMAPQPVSANVLALDFARPPRDLTE